MSKPRFLWPKSMVWNGTSEFYSIVLGQSRGGLEIILFVVIIHKIVHCRLEDTVLLQLLPLTDSQRCLCSPSPTCKEVWSPHLPCSTALNTITGDTEQNTRGGERTPTFAFLVRKHQRKCWCVFHNAVKPRQLKKISQRALNFTKK